MKTPFLIIFGMNIYQSPEGYYLEGLEEFAGPLQDAVDAACGKYVFDSGSIDKGIGD
jgi:hypothetical protein